MKKILPLFPLIIWIILFPLIGGIIYLATNFESALYISFIAIIAIFNLVWYIVRLFTKQKGIDKLTVVGNLAIFNFPAYFLIKYYSQTLDEVKPLQKYDFNYDDWEIENFKTTDLKKYQAVVDEINEHNDEQEGKQLDLNYLIMYEFAVYNLMQIYTSEPSLTNKEQLISKYRENLVDESKFSQNLLEFKEVDWSLFFKKDVVKELNENIIYQTLTNVKLEDLMMIFKINRVKMQKEAKRILDKLKRR